MEIALAALVAAAVSAGVVLAMGRVRGPVPAGAGRGGPPRRADGHGDGVRTGSAVAPSRSGGARRPPATRRRRTSCRPAAPSWAASRSACARESRRSGGPRAVPGGPPAKPGARGLQAQAGAQPAGARAGAAGRPQRRAGQAAADARARGRAAPRVGAGDPPGRGGDQARRGAPRSQHPLHRHAAGGGRPRDRDHRVGGRAALGRAEGAHHRPRGAQHPHPGEPHGDRLHHRRHPGRRAAVGIRRRAARDRAADAGEAPVRRAHPPGADRGGLRPGAGGDRPARASRWGRRPSTRPTWARCTPS